MRWVVRPILKQMKNQNRYVMKYEKSNVVSDDVFWQVCCCVDINQKAYLKMCWIFKYLFSNNINDYI